MENAGVPFTFEQLINRNMKKTVFLSIAFFGATTAFAQVSVTNAFNANKSGDFKAAAGYIEEALKDPKATGKEKTWRYRGEIYLNIANDPNLKAEFPNALTLAKESYFKNLELDKYGDYKAEVQAALAKIQEMLFVDSNKYLDNKDFCGAASAYSSIGEISGKFGILDTSMIFNTALCNDQCGKTAEAMEGYTKCAQYGYNVPDVYRYISEIHLKAGDKPKAKQVLADARAKYPNDSELLRAEVNIYLTDEEYAKAEELLISLTKADPNNEMFWYVLGITYDKLGKKSDEEEAYKKALIINPKNYDVLFNLGALYFNQGLDRDIICNEIPPRETAKYNECVAEATKLFTKAVEQLEVANSNIPENVKGTSEERQLFTALKDAYLKAGRTEDYERMKALLAK